MPHGKLLAPARTGGINRVSPAASVSGVGLAALDMDHHLVQVAIGILANEVSFRARGETLSSVTQFLTHYTRAHFKREELLMEELAYPEIETHRSSHGIMLAWMEASLPEIGVTRNPHYDDDVISYLYDWWEMHGQKEDKGYADFIQHRLDEARSIVASFPRWELPGLSHLGGLVVP